MLGWSDSVILCYDSKMWFGLFEKNAVSLICIFVIFQIFF